MEAMNVWQLCRDIYARHGRVLRVPPRTEFTNTYQWRYVTQLCQKFTEWEFDEPTAAKFIDVAVNYATDRRLLQKGLAIFCQPNMLRLCYERMKAEQEITSREADCLRKSVSWVDSQLRTGQTIEQLMLCRSDPRGYPNLVRWHQSNRITELYLALSRCVRRTLQQLPPDEREALPSDARLYLVRMNFLAAPDNIRLSREILGGDLRNGGPNPNYTQKRQSELLRARRAR